MSGLPPPECLEGILDLVDVAVSCMDLQGRVQVWNRASEELSGWTREEMIGSTVDRVVPQSALEERRKVVARGLRQASSEPRSAACRCLPAAPAVPRP